MRIGLLLSEAPEPLHAINCKKYKCGFVAHTSWDYRVHWKQVHNKVVRHFDTPIRPYRRILFTAKEKENRNNKICHCGKKVKPPRRKYCSLKCTNDWYSKTVFPDGHREQFLTKHCGKCEHCGQMAKDKYKLEMDHIIALIFGGHPWDYRNLQALCYKCHKKKSASDMKTLGWWKRECKYDIGHNT